jgi:PhzF family phenazine biosynthesis protein
MSIDSTDSKHPEYIIESPRIELVNAPYSLEELTSAMKIPKHLVDWNKPLLLEKTSGYLYFAVPSLEKLGQLQIDFNSTAQFQAKGPHVIICALTAESFDSKNHAHARGYAPLVAIPEDPFTGSMQGGLAAYLMQNKMVKEDIQQINTEQGHFIGRPGEVELHITHKPSLKIQLFAQAVHVYSTTLTLGT